MLSDLGCTTAPPFDIPICDPCTPCTEVDSPLDFDDLLDIAREFEFTRTITHIWPCEEEPDTCSETGLDDILAAIMPTPNDVEESPIPSTTIDPVHVQEIDLRTTSVFLAPDAAARISTTPAAPSKFDDQKFVTETGVPIASILRGWSPPYGSQFLDLDDSLMQPQSAKNARTPPWLPMFLSPSAMLPTGDVSQSLVTGDDSRSRPSERLSADTTDKSDDPRKRSAPTPARSLGQVQARSTPLANPNAPSQTAAIPRAKTPKLRQQPFSTSTAGGISTGNYARAPRGGIPPHLARSVTKAKLLCAEKEQKVMQDAFSNKTSVEAKKPSVLRRAAKNANGSGSGKKHIDRDENDATEVRTAKKARV